MVNNYTLLYIIQCDLWPSCASICVNQETLVFKKGGKQRKTRIRRNILQTTALETCFLLLYQYQIHVEDLQAHGHLGVHEHVVGGQYLPVLFGQCDEP